MLRFVRRVVRRVTNEEHLARMHKALVPSDRPWAPADYPEVQHIFRQNPDVVLDIGANEGQFALAARAMATPIPVDFVRAAAERVHLATPSGCRFDVAMSAGRIGGGRRRDECTFQSLNSSLLPIKQEPMSIWR